jgi:hypothetical protein
MQVPKDVQARVARMVEQLGAEEAADRLRISTETVLRVATGQNVRDTTVELVKVLLPNAERGGK